MWRGQSPREDRHLVAIASQYSTSKDNPTRDWRYRMLNTTKTQFQRIKIQWRSSQEREDTTRAQRLKWRDFPLRLFLLSRRIPALAPIGWSSRAAARHRSISIFSLVFSLPLLSSSHLLHIFNIQDNIQAIMMNDSLVEYNCASTLLDP